MPDLDICYYCKRPIRPQEDAVWEPPTAEEAFGAPIIERHVHAECYEKAVTAIEEI